jgi:hypothetical protein
MISGLNRFLTLPSSHGSPLLAFCGVVGNFGEVNEQPSSILIVEVEGDGEEKG